MPTLDDELRSRLQRAAPRPAGADDLPDRLARRRRRRASQRSAGRVTLVAAVLVGTIAGVAVLDRAFRGGAPVVSQPPVPNPDPGEDGTVSLEGVPFRVCRPMSIPGDFGAGVDTLWVFEEESEPGAGCELQGSFHVAVGDANGVASMSGRVDDQLELRDGFSPWPYATPDVDNDGIDEIALGTGGSRTDAYARVILFRLASTSEAGGELGEIRSVRFDCGTACDPVPWISFGSFVESLEGAYCDTSTETGRPVLIRWSAGEGLVDGSAWYLESDTLRLGEQLFSRPDDGSYPPDGSAELCGSPVSWPEDFPTSSPPTLPAERAEGLDIGLGVNICEDTRLDGLDLVPDGNPDTAWTGYPVDDGGRCPGRPGTGWLVAVDVTGDGSADASASPLEPCASSGCSPLGASDLDADGDGELIVMTHFSIVDHLFFSIRAIEGGYSLEPILVAEPGHRPAGIEPGSPLVTSAGGDAGYSAWIRCESYPDAPVIVFTAETSVVDSREPHEWHETTLRLQEDGMFHVVGTNDLTVPDGVDPGFERSEAPACGVDFNPLALPN